MLADMMTGEVMDIDALVARCADIEAELIRLRDQHQRMEYEIIKRMEAEGATALTHPGYDVELKSKPEYDRTKLAGLREIVPPDELPKGFTPEHSETVQVPEKWDLRRVLTWKKYGRDAQAILEAATLPGAPKLSIKAKAS